MHKQVEACVVIKSSENSEIDVFYLLRLEQEFPWNRYYIIFDLLGLYYQTKYMDSSLASCVDSLIDTPDTAYYSLSKSEYENFSSNRSMVKNLPYYYVRVDKGNFNVTFSYGVSINYSLQEWYQIAATIWELGSFVANNTFSDDGKSPCFKCIVQATCIEKGLNVNGDKVIFRALNPCPSFYEWKKDGFLEIWNTLPDDIRHLEHNIYEEMLSRASDEN